MALFGLIKSKPSKEDLFFNGKIDEMSYEELLDALSYRFNTSPEVLEKESKEGFEGTNKDEKIKLLRNVLLKERNEAVEHYQKEKAIEHEEYLREKGRQRAREEARR